MSRSRLCRAVARGGAVACTVTLGLGAPALGRAQPGVRTVTVSAPSGDTLRSVTPPFTVLATGFSLARPLRVTLQLDTTTRFNGHVVLDTTVLAPDSATVIFPDFPLPEKKRVFFRATVTDPANGIQVTSPITGPVNTPAWVTLISPPVVPGQPVHTRTPRFVWRSPQVNSPPGPWAYRVTYTNLGNTKVKIVGSDTSFVPDEDLEINAPYTWSVEASIPGTTYRTVVASTFSFVIEDPTVAVSSTTLYPSFPSPFPSQLNAATCIWFDLRNPSTVTLDVYDLRGLHVRRLLPNADLKGVLPAGRYGRGRTEFNEGCDGRVRWDGTDDRGDFVPEGVYLIRFRGDGISTTTKVLFRGRR